MQFDIRNRYTGAVQFTAEIACAEDAPASVKIGSAVIWAAMTGANLRRADLSDADLSGAYLRGANLSGAVGKFSTFQGGKHDAWAAAGKAAIGCHWHTIEYWQENYRKIGADNGYTEAEIERYGAWIMGLDWLKLPKEGDGND